MGRKAYRSALLAGLAAGLTGATPAWGQSASPLTVGSPGPTFQINAIQDPNGNIVRTQTTVVGASERGLSIPVSMADPLGPQFAFLLPVSSGVENIPNGGGPFDAFRDATGYRTTETVVVNNVTIGGGVTASVRAGGVVLASATASTAAAAQTQALAAAIVTNLPGRRLPGVVSANGITEGVTETRATMLTGYDNYVGTLVLFGPGSVAGNNLGRCTFAPVLTCEGGTRFNAADDVTLLNTYNLYDLYLTTIVNRTTTASGSILIDIPFAAYGRAHPGAQVAGFDMASRFLTRLREAGSGANGVSLGDGKVTLFLEGTATSSRYRGQGEISGARGSSEGVRGGLGFSAGDGWTLGLAGEWAQWRWRLDDTMLPERAGDDLWRIGGFAGWRGGPWRASAGIFAGRQQVATTASSTLGGGTSTARYAADLYGAGGELGYAIPAGPVTITPSVAIDWVRWHSPAFSETGGLAPLSVAAANRSQWRPGFGLAVDHQGRGFRIGASARGFLIEGDRQGLVSATDGVTAGGGAFAIRGPLAARGGAELGAHASIAVAPNASLDFGYAARIADRITTHAGQAGLRMAF